VAAALVFAVTFAPPPGAQAGPVSFKTDIAPLLAQKCFGCHGPDKTKGDYQLHTFEKLMTPGENKHPPVTPGHPEASEIFKLVTAADPDDRMPKKDDPLPPASIETVRRWIAEGAPFDGSDPKGPIAALLPRPGNPPPPEKYPRPVPILSLCFSPDGQTLAVGGYHEITLWNPANGVLLGRLTNVAAQTHALRFNRDGSALAAASGSAGRSGEVKLFDPASRREIRNLATISEEFYALAMSDDGRGLAAGGGDNIIRIFDIATGRQERAIEQHADWVLGLAFSPDGNQLVSASRDKTARVFQVGTGEMLGAYLDHNEMVYAVAVAPDGQHVVTAGRDKKLHIWDKSSASGGKQITGADGAILALTGSSNRVFSAGADKVIREHDLANRRLARTYLGHQDWVYALALDAPARRLASGSYDGEVRVWDTADGRLITSFIASPGLEGKP
jgi:WD40 repeat protein